MLLFAAQIFAFALGFVHPASALPDVWHNGCPNSAQDYQNAIIGLQQQMQAQVAATQAALAPTYWNTVNNPWNAYLTSINNYNQQMLQNHGWLWNNAGCYYNPNIYNGQWTDYNRYLTSLTVYQQQYAALNAQMAALAGTAYATPEQAQASLIQIQNIQTQMNQAVQNMQATWRT